MNTQTENQTTTNGRRRTGNIARLPKILRDKINTMLDDGYQYAEIITDLEKSKDPALPWVISEDSLGRWKNTGYQDHLRVQDRRDRMTILADRFLDPADNDPIQLASGALHNAMIQLCEVMEQLTDAKPGETDPDKLIGVTNVLSRITRSIVIISEYRDALAKAKAADPMSKEALEQNRLDFLDSMDQLFGIKPPKRQIASTEPPITSSQTNRSGAE